MSPPIGASEEEPKVYGEQPCIRATLLRPHTLACTLTVFPNPNPSGGRRLYCDTQGADNVSDLVKRASKLIAHP